MCTTLCKFFFVCKCHKNKDRNQPQTHTQTRQEWMIFIYKKLNGARKVYLYYIYLVCVFCYFRENPTCVFWIGSTLWNTCNIPVYIILIKRKKRKKRRKYSVHNFSWHMQYSKTFWVISRRITDIEYDYNIYNIFLAVLCHDFNRQNIATEN